VNRVLPDGPPCPICDRRRKDERQLVRSVARSLGRGRAFHVVHAEPDEPKTSAALVRIGAGLRLEPEAGAAWRNRSRAAGANVRSRPAQMAMSLQGDARTLSPDRL